MKGAGGDSVLRGVAGVGLVGLTRLSCFLVPVHTELSYPRMRVASTPQLIGSISGVSGIVDHPHARVMTAGLSSIAYTRNIEDGFKKGSNVHTGQRGHRVLQPAVKQQHGQTMHEGPGRCCSRCHFNWVHRLGFGR